jgi:hypothetical protein
LGSLTIVDERDQSWRFARTTTMRVARDGAVKIEAFILQGNLEETGRRVSAVYMT